MVCASSCLLAQVLTARLLSRGREADPAEVASRVARATAANPVGDHVLRINNVGSVANGVAACVAALRGQLRYSMWLVRCTSSSSLIRLRFCALSIDLALLL